MNHRGTETQRVGDGHCGRELSRAIDQLASSETRGQDRDPLTGAVIGAAIEVHRHLGPGLLESAYEECLCWELAQAGVEYQRQLSLPVLYKQVNLDIGYRLDVVVEKRLVLEIKAVDKLLAVHQAQLLTYMRLGGYPVGLLMNFNREVLKNGIIRMVL